MAPKGWVGWDQPQSDTGGHNTQDFAIWQAIKLISTAWVVRVEKVTTQGQVGPVGFVNVTPLVKMVDADGNASDHGQVNNLPFFRLQGGADKAIILDPKAGDVGLAVIADRDISSVKKNKAPSTPGSRRRFDPADGCYFGGFLGGGSLKSVLQFMDDGTMILSNMQASASQPFQCVVGKNFVQIKQKGVPDMHITIDEQTGEIIIGKAVTIGPDPYPDY